MGRYKNAMEDLNESLNLNPDFLPARMQRAISLYRQGRLYEAQLDFEHILHHEPHNEEAHQYYSALASHKQHMDYAKELIHGQHWHEAIEVLNELIQELYWCYELKEMRAEAFEHVGDVVSAINDIRSLTRLKSDNTDGFYKLSKLHYLFGEPEDSLHAIRECLKLDPDHKQCHAHYKVVKKVANLLKKVQDEIGNNEYQDCVDKAKAALNVEKEVPKIVFLIKSKMCHCLNKVMLSAIVLQFRL